MQTAAVVIGKPANIQYISRGEDAPGGLANQSRRTVAARVLVQVGTGLYSVKRAQRLFAGDRKRTDLSLRLRSGASRQSTVLCSLSCINASRSDPATTKVEWFTTPVRFYIEAAQNNLSGTTTLRS